jgi:formylmethanofuran dehydrogenase subunit C
MKTPLTFTTRMCLSKSVKFLVDCRGLTPNLLHGLSIDEINHLTLTQNNQYVKVSDVFDVAGDVSQHIIFNHDTANVRLDCIGTHMREGKITLNGNAGDYCGLNMHAGKIFVHGNTQDLTACNMLGGNIIVHGNVGDFLGGALDGSRKGMKNGTVIVKGNAGARVGDQMRRGLILIEGNAGDYCGSRMIAGTIGVMGNIGNFAGFNMQRGTLLLKSTLVPHATMQDCGTHTLPFLSLLYQSFSPLDTAFSQLKSQRVRRYICDLSNNGNGEILEILE